MKSYLKPDLECKNIVALEHINNNGQPEFDSWVDENEIDGVTIYDAGSLF